MQKEHKFIYDSYGNRIYLGYNAVQTKKGRLSPRSSITSEETELTAYDKRKLIGTARDQTRNMSLVAWMVRKHLNYVASFTFQAQTGDKNIDAFLEKMMRNYNRKRNCDITNRHSLSRMIRLFEITKVIDGDAGLLKLSDGKLQGVEGSRIAKPTSISADISEPIDKNGLVTNKSGKVEKYAVCKYKKQDGTDTSSLELDHLVDAENLIFDGYFTRFEQYRGISPLSSALNTLQDLAESWEYALIKSKIHAMFGVAIMSEAKDSQGSGFWEKDSVTGEAPTSSTQQNGYEFDLQYGLKLELEPGDKIDTIESHTPSTEFKDYTELMVRIALLSLDIPYSFYNSAGSSFSAMKGDRAEYELSASAKREGNEDALMEVTDWKVQQWIDAGAFRQFKQIKIKKFSDLDYSWIPAGQPWLDELQEINAAKFRIDAGLSSRQRECKRRGLSFDDIVFELEQEEKLIKKAGVNIVMGMPGQGTIAEQKSTNKPDVSDDTKEIKDNE